MNLPNQLELDKRPINLTGRFIPKENFKYSVSFKITRAYINLAVVTDDCFITLRKLAHAIYRDFFQL